MIVWPSLVLALTMLASDIGGWSFIYEIICSNRDDSVVGGVASRGIV